MLAIRHGAREKDESGNDLSNKVTDGPYFVSNKNRTVGDDMDKLDLRCLHARRCLFGKRYPGRPLESGERSDYTPNYGHGMLFRTLTFKLVMSIHSHKILKLPGKLKCNHSCQNKHLFQFISDSVIKRLCLVCGKD